MSRRAWAERVLDRALPDGRVGEAIRGELREERDRRVSRDGEVAADRWYLRQAVGVWVFAKRDALLGRGWRGGDLPDGRTRRATGRAGDGGGRSRRGGIHDSGDTVHVRLARDVRLSLRSLARAPGFTVPALLILSVGLTAATAIFAFVDGVVFRPLDYAGSERLVIVCEDHARLQGACIASAANTEDFRTRTSTLSELGIARGWPFTLTDTEGSRGVRGGLVTAGFLRALRVRPAVGRLFLDDEVGPGGDAVVLLAHAFWTDRYGADPSVVGSTVDLGGSPHTVVGVLPRGLEFPFDLANVSVWKPPYFDPLDPEVRGWRGFRAIGRLADGASLPSAEAELTGLYAGLAQSHEEIDDEWRLRVDPLRTVVAGDARPVLLAFLAAAAVLLLIVCANVANLVLARGMDRRRELTLRVALGADRRRLVTGLFVESLVLSGLAALLAISFSSGAVQLLIALAPPEIPRLDQVAVGGRVLGFSVLLSLAATVAFAAAPAVRVTRGNLGQALRTAGGDGRGEPGGRLRSALLVSELALAVMLLASAGVLTRTLAGYLDWEPGFDRSSLIAVSAFADVGRYTDGRAVAGLWRESERALTELSVVGSVATASAGPLFGGGDGATSFRLAGGEADGVLPSAAWYDVGPGYFSTLGVPLLRGREIEETDGLGATPVVVVNEALERASGVDDVVGHIVSLPELGRDFEVVGVVADVPPMTPGDVTRPEIYWSNRQFPRAATYFLIRARGDPAQASAAVTNALLAVDSDMSLGTPQPLTVAEARALVRPRFQAVVLLAFALVALALSAVGVYGVVAYSVARRVREVGIRMALGAAAGDVVLTVLRQSLGVALVGVGLGLMASLGAGRLLEGAVHGVRGIDATSLAASALLLLSVAAVSTLIPAWRAVRANPLQAIRGE